MTTHFMFDMVPTCANSDAKTEEGQTVVTPVESDVTCIECMIHLEWEKYISQPANFGEDSHSIRLAEEDAFKAGARAMLKMKIPF